MTEISPQPVNCPPLGYMMALLPFFVYAMIMVTSGWWLPVFLKALEQFRRASYRIRGDVCDEVDWRPRDKEE